MPTATLRRTVAGAGPAALAGLVVLLEIAYPLVDGHLRDQLTVATVVVFFSATVSHAALSRGAAWALGYTAISVGTGLAAEALGVATGLPFGDYVYGGSLGWQVLGVPVVVPLAWAMFAYPCLIVGRRLGHPVLAGAMALASWDLFLDPQMVQAQHWRWLHVTHHLPGVPHVPLSDFAGWLLVATLLMAGLQLLPSRQADDRVPGALFLWTYASSVLANAVFFGRLGVAVVGGVAMGIVALPYARTLTR